MIGILGTKKGNLSVKGATNSVNQKFIGGQPHIEDMCVTLLVLAHNHNVVDSILYDCRGTPVKIYFVQTSSQAYSKIKNVWNLRHATVAAAILEPGVA